jgi:acetyltransferase (GNAT) family protein
MSQIRISTLPEEQISQLKPLLERTPYKPYRFLIHDPDAELDSLWLNEIASFPDGQSKAFVAMEKSNPVSMIVYTDNLWETKVFRKRMGILRYVVVDSGHPQKSEIAERSLRHAVDWASSSGIEFLLCKTYTDDLVSIHALEKEGFLLMDTMLDFVYDFRKHPLEAVPRPSLLGGVIIRKAEENDLEEMITLARNAFRGYFGRFHADEKIPKNQATRVYEEWVKSAYSGYADWTLVAELDRRIVGYSVWRKPPPLEQSLGIKVGAHSICAIHADNWGRGLYRCFNYEGMELLKGVAEYIFGPTHIDNHPCHRALNGLHWRMRGARHSFHKWL